VRLALALTVALASPILLPTGLYHLFRAVEEKECPFNPVDADARIEIDKLFKLNQAELASALGDQDCLNLTKSVALQLVNDANHGLFSETWVASAPIVLRNAFLSWLVVKLFFLAADMQDRGLLGVVALGHGARSSVVGDGGTADSAGWVALVGDASRVAPAWMIDAGIVFTMVMVMAWRETETALHLDTMNAGTARHRTEVYMFALLLFTCVCSTIYRQLQTLPTAPAQRQPTWDDARKSLGLTARQAIGLSVAKFVLWHNSQPVAYVLVFNRYFGCSEFMTSGQQILGSIVAARELMYMFSTVVAAIECPVYLLLDLRTVLKEANTWFQSTYRCFAYLATPHIFVSLCLANRSAELRLVFLPLAFFQVVADFASCFALGSLLSNTAQSPAAIKIGYTITSAAFLLFFGPLSVLSLLQKARDKDGDEGRRRVAAGYIARQHDPPHRGQCGRAFSACSGVMLALGLLYVIMGFIFSSFDFDTGLPWWW
jgi:hypothetical protein